MTNSKELFQQLCSRLTLDEDADELTSLIYLLLEKKVGLSKTDILAGKAVQESLSSFESILFRINNHEPIQYILGEADFFGRSFIVNTAVLIPRPETELLVQSAIDIARNISAHTLNILDIGTGSGCIAISLACELRHSYVTALDISDSAIACTQKNADRHQTSINFLQLDILKEDLPPPQLDLIVSNPPYIDPVEKKDMRENVLAYEPHLALFTPEDDPLIFYRAIAQKSKHLLTHQGAVLVEINSRFGAEVAQLFKDEGYTQVDTIKDLDQKDRIVLARH